MSRITTKEKIIAIAKLGLYEIARGCPEPQKKAQGVLSAIADFKHRAALKAASKESKERCQARLR